MKSFVSLACAMVCMVVTSSAHAVYNFKWHQGKPVPCNRAQEVYTKNLSHNPRNLPVAPYGHLMVMLVGVQPQLAALRSQRASQPRPCSSTSSEVRASQSSSLNAPH